MNETSKIERKGWEWIKSHTLPNKICMSEFLWLKIRHFPLNSCTQVSEKDRILRLSEKIKDLSSSKKDLLFKMTGIMRGKREAGLTSIKIRELYRNGENVEKIAADFKLHHATVYCIIQERTMNPKKCGRPTKMSMHEYHCLINEFCQKKFMTATKLADSGRFSISDRTIHRELHRNDFHHRKV